MIKTVTATEIESLKDYAVSIMTAMASLRTLELYHVTAYQKGLLDTDEIETSHTIIWEIKRLLNLYKTQMQHVLDRNNINEDEIVSAFHVTMPDIKIPKKKPQRKKNVVE